MVNQAQSLETTTKRPKVLAFTWAWTLSEKGPLHFGDSTGDWVKEREGVVPLQSMAPRPRNNKGSNAPPTAFKPVGENEVAFRQRNGVPLVEQEVVSEQRRARQEPNLVT